ncbi:MAG TPA: glycosyltransferase [Tepidisphaeraceae bacterium]|jgi:GT2 family glycosyltransferase
MFDLSIVLPTCNRASLLEKCLASIWSNVACRYELIVVDGASGDGTQRVLADAGQSLGERLTVITEPAREGFVRAANKGFRVARGRYLTWLNDDAYPLPGAFDRAIEQFERETGGAAADSLLALFHRWSRPRNIAYETQQRGRAYRLCHVRGTLYANFALGRRELFEKLGYFDERYYVCAADPDLSLKAWEAGHRVEPAWGCIIDHDEHVDDRRAADTGRGQEDNAALFAKWDLPAVNPLRNDFSPMNPCTLHGLRPEHALAA